MNLNASAGPQFKRRTQLSDEVASYVRDLIMSGQLRGGEYVRSDKLADELGVSSTPVREGLLALRGEGFVRLERHRGFVVEEITRDDILDLFQAQAMIAGELAARAARSTDTTYQNELSEIQRRLEQAAQEGDVALVEELNDSFHKVINRTAGSRKLAWFLSVAVQYVPRRYFASIEGWRDASVTDHADILRALKKGDSKAAHDAMAQHIKHAGELLADNLQHAISPRGSSANEEI